VKVRWHSRWKTACAYQWYTNGGSES